MEIQVTQNSPAQDLMVTDRNLPHCVLQLAEQLKALTAFPDGTEAGTPGTHRKQGSCEWASLGPAGNTHRRGHSCPGREISPLLVEPWLRDQGGVALGTGLTPGGDVYQSGLQEMQRGPPLCGFNTDFTAVL